MNEPSVSVIILNYNGEYLLKKCLSSLKNQTYPPLEIIVVDNASTDGSIDLLKNLFPEVKLITNKKNFGFAKGNNVGLEKAAGDYVFLLNNDTEVHPRCIEEMVKVAAKDEAVAGVAPKTLFYFARHFIDNIGALVNYRCVGFNKGVGQIDIGQYDSPEQTFGPSFGAALIKKWAFSEEHVGKMDDSYFMYYEDIDWCYRANLQGYKFYTAPQAHVYHLHSASTRKKPFKTKIFLLERNLFRTIIKNFEFKRAVRQGGHLILRNIYSSLVIRDYPWARLKVVLQSMIELPYYLYKRREIQKRRKIGDEEVFKYSEGENGYFDPVNYLPIYSINCLLNAYRRLYTWRKDPKSLKTFQKLAASAVLEATPLSPSLNPAPSLKKLLAEAVKEAPQFVKDYANSIELPN